MADSERFKTGGEPVDPAQRRDELDQLLQRIAAHIAEVDKSAGVQPGASGEDAAASAHEDRAEATPSDDLGGAHEAPPEPPTGAQGGHDEAAPDAGDEPWDSDTAEALTRSYETEASVPPLRSILNLMAQRRESSGQVGPRVTGQPAATGLGDFSNAQVDAAQTRLFEAARRVETMLDRLAPREAVEALGDRFQALEGEVRRSGDQLARLDGIEQRLGELGQKLTDEQVVNLFGTLVPTAEELTQFAEDAAGRAAERVLEAYARDIAPAEARLPSDAPSAIGGELASLGERLGAYMDERRRNDASTVEALETLQLAMQHVLDRIDRADGRVEAEKTQPIETGGVAGLGAHADRVMAGTVPPHEEPSDQFGPVDAGHRDLDEAPEGIINLTANQATGASDLTAESYSMPASVLHDVTRPGADVVGEQHAAPQDRADPLPHGLRHAEGAHAMPPMMPPRHEPALEVAGVETSENQPQSDRQRLIAMARKAAERANAQASQPTRRKVKEPRSPSAAVKRSIFGIESTGVIRPGVLIVAIAAIALAGYWLLFGQKNGLLRSLTSAAIEQPQSVAMAHAGSTPARAPAGDAAPTGTAEAAHRASVQATAGAAPVEVPSSAPMASQHETGANTASGDALGPGMAVSFGASPASAESVMRARERARIANLSQRAAFSAAGRNAIRDTAPLPAVAKADPQSGQESPIATSSVAEKAIFAPSSGIAARSQASQQLDLPPATTGPLSLRLAAAKGDAAAQLEIATRLAEGRGVRQNFAEAARWYERSADQGHAVAQYRLATLYERGMGVKADRKKAQALYEKAAARGNLKAMHNLAVISASPAGGVPDYITAARLFSRAAQHGLHDSQYNLGVLYESGLGVPKDHGAAYKWYSLAARGGDTVAARRRDLLISRLPPETIQAMDAQIAGWQAAPADEAANNVRVASGAWMQSSVETHRR